MLTTTPVRTQVLSIDLITPATVPVLTTTEAKAHLNVTGSTDDTLIDALVKAATRRVENLTKRSLISQTWRVVHRGSAMPLRIYRPPVLALTVVKTWYQGTATTEASLAGFYVKDALGRRPSVMLTDTGDFTEADIEEVEFRYTAGYGTASTDVPEPLIQAVRYALTTLYDRRDEAGASEAVAMPGIVTELCADYIIHTI